MLIKSADDKSRRLALLQDLRQLAVLDTAMSRPKGLVKVQPCTRGECHVFISQ